MRVGYLRVSSVDQNLDRQLDGIELDRVYEEKISGKDRERPQLKECLLSLDLFDNLYIQSMHFVATNNKEIFNFLLITQEAGVTVCFVDDGLIVSPCTDLSLLKKLKDFEVNAVKERQCIGREVARKNGKQIGAREIPQSKKDAIKRRRINGESVKSIAKAVGVSHVTAWKYGKL